MLLHERELVINVYRICNVRAHVASKIDVVAASVGIEPILL